MKRLIVITLILIAATAYVTVKYFDNLTISNMRAGNILRTIPDDAALVFEFANEKSFYDIFAGNQLISNIIGEEKSTELDTLNKTFAGNAVLQAAFTGSNIYASIHGKGDTGADILLTAAAQKNFDIHSFDKILKEKKSGFVLTPLKLGDKQGYTIYLSALKKRFYIVHKEANIYAGSFSKDLLLKSVAFKHSKDKISFLLLPDKQNSNSLANLYVNYQQLNPLFDNFFRPDHYSDIFKSFRLLPALAALNLNYKADALMFSGYSNIQQEKTGSYLNIFTAQKPVKNVLKELYPSTTAYAMTMGVSDPHKYMADLDQFQLKAGLRKEKDALLAKIKAETGIALRNELNSALGNEFAVVTTRYQEKFAIIDVKDGSKLFPVMSNISVMITNDIGQFNYGKVPFLLMGDAFNSFKRPYFQIMDNLLILANSAREIESFANSYLNHKLLNKTDQYLQFDNLMSERSNVAFFINFKNSQSILKSQLKTDVYSDYLNNERTFKNFYAASYQLTAADDNFYTNFCMQQLQRDTTAN
ncbi:hypothetical protein FPZ43_04235 [Mucilaginibacter pallidiroseus]|uniref:DUF3352 domain-containing protein n=1 Tax=Mucilaginibacter pallidiroseus TaxID=2599295 RepID=A0A563UK86_9SPHI|nr:hypothetical protein [Mucilaginibacter pallidiroseus]TWR31688.1 hypothetical protein FPZ43_04235 [Mucilaginibacter pallidiroseus]